MEVEADGGRWRKHLGEQREEPPLQHVDALGVVLQQRRRRDRGVRHALRRVGGARGDEGIVQAELQQPLVGEVDAQLLERVLPRALEAKDVEQAHPPRLRAPLGEVRRQHLRDASRCCRAPHRGRLGMQLEGSVDPLHEPSEESRVEALRDHVACARGGGGRARDRERVARHVDAPGEEHAAEAQASAARATQQPLDMGHRRLAIRRDARHLGEESRGCSNVRVCGKGWSPVEVCGQGCRLKSAAT